MKQGFGFGKLSRDGDLAGLEQEHQTSDKIGFGDVGVAVFRRTRAARSDSDGHDAAGESLTAEEIDDGAADPGGVNDESDIAVEFRAAHQCADAIHDFGIGDVERNPLQVADGALDENGPLIGDQALTSRVRPMFKDRDGAGVANLAEIEPDEKLGRRTGGEVGIDHDVTLFEERLNFIADGLGDEILREQGFLSIDEFAEKFLTEPAIPDELPLPLQSVRVDARAFGGGNAKPMPAGIGFGFLPMIEEEATAAVGSAEEPETAFGGEEHWHHGVKQVIRDTGSFVDDKHAGSGEAPDLGFGAGQSDNAGAIGKQDGDIVAAIALGPDVEAAQEMSDLVDELTTLAATGTQDDDEAFGFMPSVKDGAGGRHGGFAPLAGAIEDDLVGRRSDDRGLMGVREEAKALTDERQGVQGVAKVLIDLDHVRHWGAPGIAGLAGCG